MRNPFKRKITIKDKHSKEYSQLEIDMMVAKANNYKDSLAEFKQRHEDINMEHKINIAAIDLYSEEKQRIMEMRMKYPDKPELHKCFGIRVYPVMGFYTIHDPNTAKYKDKDIHEEIDKKIKELKEKDNERQANHNKRRS